jgi:Stage II sporulation protein E (SpoIIE)
MFALPPGAGRNGSHRTITLAFRVWMEPSTLLAEPDAGGFHTAPVLGHKDMVSAGFQVRWLELVRTYATDLVFAALYLILALLAFSLSIFDRSDKVYYWLAAVYLVSAAQEVLITVSGLGQTISSPAWYGFEGTLVVPLIDGLWIMVWWVWFRLERPAWLPKAVAGETLLYMVGNLLGGEFIFGLVSHPVAAWFHMISIAARAAFAVLLVIVVVLGGRRQGREGWVALPAVALLAVSKFASELGLLHIRLSWFPFGVGVGLGTAASLLLIVALVFLLLRRMLISLRLQREQALDIKQAAGVQQLIMPQAYAVYPGVTVESEYRPSRQVGGDFFQVIPNQVDGSLLLVAGDVAGKGLQAGMLVALIVGAVRTATEATTDPLSILEILNRRLVGRSSAQATCLAMSIAANGSVTLANAGHIPPYVNGLPLAMEGALPLGILSEAEFSVMRFQLPPEDRLVVISDGVPEAMNENGELFGFDRIAQLLRDKLNITAIAEAVQNFGQNDDISLVALTRTAVL